MPRFAANLSLMYQEHDFLERFGAAAKDGFRGAEPQGADGLLPLPDRRRRG
jgi:hydroxypyruvate isomerase